VILSLERMRAVRALDAVAGTMTVEAGAILSDIHDAAEAEGLIFPLTLASQGSARIGGLLSTNAGGVNVIRYGNARDLCLGIEAVLPDGSVMHTLSGLRKNNMGYDLRHLLIGAEGTLGVITAATLRLFPKPATTGAALMVVPDAAAALGLLRLAQARVGAGLSAFEIMHRMGLDFLREVGPEVRHPFAEPPDWMCLIDLGMGVGDDPAGALETLFAEGFEQGFVTDGLVAQSEAQRAEFWTLRETIPLANRRIGAISSHDISVPVAAIPGFIAKAPERLAEIGDYRINCFGHLGDGNLHYNVFPLTGRIASDHAAERPAIKACVHDLQPLHQPALRFGQRLDDGEVVLPRPGRRPRCRRPCGPRFSARSRVWRISSGRSASRRRRRGSRCPGAGPGARGFPPSASPVEFERRRSSPTGAVGAGHGCR
jgi:FAD/FMN-containing dehydrogenase